MVVMGAKGDKDGDILALRKAGGQWLKQKREERGLSQSQLAAALGSYHYTFISQIEIGRSRVPHDRYSEWSTVLGISELEFVKQMLRFYDPALFQIMFRDEINMYFNPTDVEPSRNLNSQTSANH